MRIPILDRPGAAAEVFTLAAELGVNIADFEVVHMAESNRGVAVVLIDAAVADLYRGGLIARGFRPPCPASVERRTIEVRLADRDRVRSTPSSTCPARRASPTGRWCAPPWPTGTAS